MFSRWLQQAEHAILSISSFQVFQWMFLVMKCLELEEVLKSVVKIQESQTHHFLKFNFGYNCILIISWLIRHIDNQLVNTVLLMILLLTRLTIVAIMLLRQCCLTQRKADSSNDPVN